MRELMAMQDLVWGSPLLREALRALPGLGLRGGYLAAGCLAQTAWNARFRLPPGHGIDDLDIVYFDADDPSEAAEQAAMARAREALGCLGVRLDVKNEARVHEWYEAKFGYAIPPYRSVEAAIHTFPTTATAVGARLSPSGLVFYAPFGLSDLLGGIVRPNKAQITREIYERKVDKWRGKWPGLACVAW